MDVESLARQPAIACARAALRETDAETLRDLLDIVQVPAPPFGEAARAALMRERFQALGLADVHSDERGNVLARLPGLSEGSARTAGRTQPVLLSAHLDTIFPDGTGIAVRRNGARIYAPGIADDARGLAALLACARALRRAGVVTPDPLVLAATVGEEGLGDLRGVKYLFRTRSPWRRARAFITLDGTGARRIVHRALGSRRLRILVSGPGGHSWADWGLANPIHALGLAIAALTRLPTTRQPRVALTVGRMAGGTSVNAIPDQAWLELDLRSEDGAALAELETRVRDAVRSAITDVNARRRRGTPALALDLELIGDRPTGETPADSALVRAARAATRFIGQTPELVCSSTDANVPIALGIPAIAMGAGGESGGTHTLEEWYSNEGGVEGIERAMLTALAITGVE